MSLTRSDLHPYQSRAVEFVKDKPYCALWIGMRLGKTITTLTAIADLYDDFAVTQVLVVAPLRVALSSWPRDFHKWDHIKHLSYQVINGTPAQRERAANTYAHVHIVNVENLAWLVQHHGKEWPYDMVVLDEARAFKNHKRRTGLWGKMTDDERRTLTKDGRKVTNGGYTRFGAMAKVRPKVSRVVELTGTPAPGGLPDLWAQMYLLDGGARLGKTITSFRDRFFDYNKYTFTYVPKKGSKERIFDLVSDITFVLESGDYVSLPEKIPAFVDVPLPKKAMDAYRTLEQEFVMEFDGGEVEILSAAAKLNKLMQISNGAAYIDEDKNWVEYHQEKLLALEEIIEEANGENVLVVYTHIPDKERILKKFKKFKFLDKNPKTIDDWNAGKIPGLVCHGRSAGHGLDLFGGGNIIVWFGQTHDLEIYQQLNERLSVPEKTEPIRIYHLCGEGTVDRDVAEVVLESKSMNQKELLTEVKKRMEKRGR